LTFDFILNQKNEFKVKHTVPVLRIEMAGIPVKLVRFAGILSGIPLFYLEIQTFWGFLAICESF
jgi:hypothetical protein